MSGESDDEHSDPAKHSPARPAPHWCHSPCGSEGRIEARKLAKLGHQWESEAVVYDFVDFEVDDALGSGKATHTFGAPIDRGSAGELEGSTAVEVHEQ